MGRKSNEYQKLARDHFNNIYQNYKNDNRITNREMKLHRKLLLTDKKFASKTDRRHILSSD